MLEKLLARTCYKLEWKRIGLGVLIGFFIVTTSICSVPRPNTYPLSIFPRERLEPIPAPLCNFSGEKSNFCELDGDIRIHGNSSSIFFNSPQLANNEIENSTWSIKLYARKTDEYVMKKAKELWLKPVTSHDHKMPKCTVNHSIPAIIFSSGGYAGNYFHDMTDVLIPLYLTSLQFNGEVQLLAQEQRFYFTERHEVMLKALSNYKIIDLDLDKEVRCFNSAIVGLKSHKDFGIDPNMFPYGLTLRNFTHFARKIYSLQREKVNIISVKENRKPRLLIISRKNSRAILNENELVNEAQSIGYDVVLIDARMNLKKFSKIVNSIDVMLGVHGAGLTNMVYLPENAVIIQVVPLGLESISRIFFEDPAKDMNLNYVEYKVSVNESSLIQQYPSKHQIITSPKVIEQESWHKFKKIYLDNQDVRLDMSRFKVALLKAMEYLRQ